MVRTGALRTAAGVEYPIMRGIPRLVTAERYATSFGFEWSRWPRVQFESENSFGPMAGWTRRMWERNTGVGDDAVQGKTIVEFDCGPGRFLDVVRRKGGTAVGLDLSLAVEAARKKFTNDPDVLIVQGDLLAPPFRPGAFGAGYSIGVLHHTPHPEVGLCALAASVKPQGWVACCVYPKGGLYDYASTKRFRALHRKLSKHFGYRPALAYSYFSSWVLVPLFQCGKSIRGLRRILNMIERNWLVNVPLPDARWRILDTFDAITPSIATTHDATELRDWMERAGCMQIRRTDWCATSMVGIKNASDQ